MPTYTIFINRNWETPEYTLSNLNIPDAKITGYVLERPGPDSMISHLNKRIPEGTYNLDWHQSRRFAKYKEVPILSNDLVSKDRFILIHPGNNPKDSQGCLLPARAMGDGKITLVSDSVSIFLDIKRFLKEKGIENVKACITSCYKKAAH